MRRKTDRDRVRKTGCSVAVISQMDLVHGLYLISNYPVLFITQQGGADFIAGFKMKMQMFRAKHLKTFVFTVCRSIHNVLWVTLSQRANAKDTAQFRTALLIIYQKQRPFLYLHILLKDTLLDANPILSCSKNSYLKYPYNLNSHNICCKYFEIVIYNTAYTF